MMSGLLPHVHLPRPAQLYEVRADLVSGAPCGWATLGGGVAAACRDAARWQANTLAIPVRRLCPDRVARALDRSRLPPERLELVLSASRHALSLESLLAASAIRDLGVGLAVGGFEVSPAILRRLPLTVVTLDPALTRALPGSQEETGLAGAIIQMGHALGLTVVAQGVVTEQQRACLARLGCDQGQGKLFGAPSPAHHSLACGSARSAPASRHDDEHSFRRAGSRYH